MQRGSLASHVPGSTASQHSGGGKGKKRNTESSAQPLCKRPKPGGPSGAASSVLQSFLLRKTAPVDRVQEGPWERGDEVEGVACNLRQMGDRLQALEEGVQ